MTTITYHGTMFQRCALKKGDDWDEGTTDYKVHCADGALDKDDERNIAISNRAKAKAYDGMLFVLAALMVSFALMGADMAVVLLLVFAYLFIVGEFIYYLNKYQKEM